MSHVIYEIDYYEICSTEINIKILSYHKSLYPSDNPKNKITVLIIFC